MLASEPVVEVPSEFSDDEFSRLPAYLVSLGVVDSIEKSSEMVKQASLKSGKRNTKDVLCSFWYLLPQTKSAIEESLVGEYYRLAETEKVITVLMKSTGTGKSLAKRAYEFVASTSGFESAPLPVEVLVSALGVSYGEWMEHIGERKPLWGLLYDEEYPDAQTYIYRTRNTVVTEVLLRALNRGSISHAGTFRCLRDLLKSCTSVNVQYKVFLQDVLVERRHLIEARFSYEQAMELYNVALAAYPGSFGVIEHHQCLVNRHLGGDSQQVYEKLKELIARSMDRTRIDEDSPGNLHTSAAATLHQLIKEQKIDTADGAELVFDHVSKAIALDQLSLHSHHVHAKTLLTIARSLRTSDHLLYMANVERATRIVDRALLIIAPKIGRADSNPDLFASAQLFEELRERILDENSDLIDPLKQLELFRSTGDQTGLAFTARILLGKAKKGVKGSLYKKADEFIRMCFRTLAEATQEASDELLLCRVELVVHWQLLQYKGPIYWEQLENDLEKIVRNPRYSTDFFWTFFLAVAKYNQKKFPEAESLFQTLRVRNLPLDTRNVPICAFLGDKAEPRVFEGKISLGSNERRFIYSADLANDVLVRKGQLAGRDTTQVRHFRIAFTYYGAQAVDFDSNLFPE